MMRNLKSTKQWVIVLWVVIFILMGVFVQSRLAYSLAMREQLQLFRYTSDYLFDTLWAVGGLNSLVSQFLLQFFRVDGMATVITTILLALGAWLLYLSMRRMGISWSALPFSLMPSLFLVVSLTDNAFCYEGLTAVVLCLLLLYAYTFCSACRPLVRVLTGAVLTVVLFLCCGAVAYPYALMVWLYDGFLHGFRRNLSFISLVAVCILGPVSARLGAFGAAEYYCTPAAYCDYTQPFNSIHWASWVAMVLSLPLAKLFSMWLDRMSALWRGITCALLSVLFALVAYLQVNKHWDEYHERINRLEYYASKSDWDKIISRGQSTQNYIEANYLNLALAETGQLTSKLFSFPQSSPLSLLNYNNKKDYTNLVACARVLLAMGNIAAAQSLASNTDQTRCGHNPSMLKMLAQCEIIRGNYITAEKYLDQLSQSLFYASWANDQRRYLNNDKLVWSDKFYANARRDMNCQESFVLYKSPMDDLFNILDANPADTRAMQYGLSYLLLAKDVNNIMRFIDRYYGKPALRSLPLCAQEALAFGSDYYSTMPSAFALDHGMSQADYDYYHSFNADYCRTHGVSADTMNRMGAFKNDYNHSEQNPNQLAGYAHTFWFYMFFVQI